jgi:hypothetical protein
MAGSIWVLELSDVNASAARDVPFYRWAPAKDR